MSHSEIQALRENILKGMTTSAEKLKAFKKMMGRKIAISDNGIVKIVEPGDIK